MNLPSEYSPAGEQSDRIVATGPFIVEATIAGGTYLDVGFDMSQLDGEAVRWWSFVNPHLMVPEGEPRLENGILRFTTVTGSSFVIRPLRFGDGALVGDDNPTVPTTENESIQYLQMLAARLYAMHQGTLAPYPQESGEENLYLTRGADGEPLALVKISTSTPTLLRQDGGWRQLAEDEDDLLGETDMPVREDAVTAWDSGNIQRLEDLLMDDRFSPNDVTNVWLEVGDTDELERLLIQRSRDRVYQRTSHGTWEKAVPNEEAAALDVVWSAVNSWDTGELRKLWQAERFDANGDAA